MSKPVAIINGQDFVDQCRFASNEQTHYFLIGVFVDVANKRLAATDGHRLGVVVLGDTGYTDVRAASFIISASKEMQRATKPDRNCAVWLRCYEDQLEVIELSARLRTAPDDLCEYIGDVKSVILAERAYVDGPYPDYMRVLPDPYKVSGESLHSFNGASVATFANPRSGSERLVNILPDGPFSPCLIMNADPRFVGVLMPKRDGGDMRARIGELLGFPEPAARGKHG